MPESTAVPETPSAPTPSKPTRRWPLYILGALTLVAMVGAYAFFNKYKHSQAELTETKTTLTQTTEKYNAVQESYNDYKKATESHSTWVKYPLIIKGKPVFDLHGNVVYYWKYSKSSSSDTSLASGGVTNTSSAVTTISNTTDVIHEKKETTEGQLIHGYFWVGLPTGVFSGHLNSLSIGYQREVFLGFSAGVELTAGNLQDVDPLRDLKTMVLFGHGTP